LIVDETLATNSEQHSATLELIIHTGRRHQIRRHLALIGHPVLGDPRYGTGNKNTAGLQLTAVALSFVCPLRKRAVAFAVPGAAPQVEPTVISPQRKASNFVAP